MNDLKIGDKVLTIERYGDKVWKWNSIIIDIKPNYIETSYMRDYKNEELLDLCKNLAPNHRTFSNQYVRNYYSPDGVINIERIK